MTPRPLRLMIFDRTCRGRPGLPGLSHTWSAGGRLYGGLARLDAWRGIESWEEGLRFLATHEAERPLAEIQFWGHGRWGDARVGSELLDRGSLAAGHRLRPHLEAVRERLTGDALWWFRTCETFGALPGQDFARAFTDFFGGRAAGHTFVIHLWQSGLHGLRAGEAPHWSPTEGLAEGDPGNPRRAKVSAPWQPRTISCFAGTIPEGWFTGPGD
ncbi:MAG: hypothetical protein P1V51_02745 [Deltaproteobacteria bacterium]|nr:hypothetical protein [Deltaproteobacteria bacterium]